MATATVDQTQQAAGTELASSNVVIEREDLVVGFEGVAKDSKGVEYPVGKYYSAETATSDEFAKEHPDFKEQYRITVQRSKPRNYAGIQEICGEEAESEAAQAFYNGSKQKQVNKLNKDLLDVDETGKAFTLPTALAAGEVPEKIPFENGILNLDGYTRMKPGRVTLTEDEKMVRSLSGLPDNTALAMYNVWRQSIGMQAVATFPRS